jgi:peptide chain release factor subunit 1
MADEKVRSVALEDAQDKNIEQWKIKKVIKSLEAARGNGTSMISLIIPPKDQIARVQKMLAEEHGTASNIKSRVTRLSVLSAITSTQERLKLYHKVPPNGLVVYCGKVITEDGKEKMVTMDMEPFQAINTSLYLCDNKFHVEALKQLLENDDKFGFIVMDGNGCLFGTLCGNTRDVVHKISVDLPKKHGRGGQSSMRFGRIRMEKRHAYVKKCCELATQVFIVQDRVTVSGIVLAGSADFKNELNAADFFDPRLSSKVIKTVDVSYGGENGFNQAIELSADTLGNVKFIQEKKLIQQYFDEISQDTGRYCFGINDTINALEQSAVDTLIVWENLELERVVLKDSTGAEETHFLKPEQISPADPRIFLEENGVEKEIIDRILLVEWFTEHFKEFGCNLELVTNRSTEGSQFCRGFGGMGAILRYVVDFTDYQEEAAARQGAVGVLDGSDSEYSFNDDDFDLGL